jgi:uroporphyrin-III C-methyltransferase
LSKENKAGKLYLIGAGPGDPELLTLKAARVLGECDVVLYDRLVSPEVLSFARADAQQIYVGKHEGEQNQTQTEIFDLIRQHALQGKTVARLKGGDPLIFGRGGEEWALARETGIAVELIPGITSAVAVPGLAGIPLTYRGVSQSFAVITGHCLEGRSGYWQSYAGVHTLVILMGVKNRAHIAQSLIAAGRSVNEPVAFIQRGTTRTEEVLETTLAAVAAGDTKVHNPAVFVIGRVVKLRSRLKATGQAPKRPSPAAES